MKSIHNPKGQRDVLIVLGRVREAKMARRTNAERAQVCANCAQGLVDRGLATVTIEGTLCIVRLTEKGREAFSKLAS